MDDLISRQAALTALRTCYDTNLIVLDNGDELIHYGDAVGAIEALPSAQSGCEDAVYRKAVQMLLAYFVPEERYAEAVDGLRRLPSAQPGWIPVTERLPEDAYPVIVTWKNDDPKSYYQYILGKHYTGVAHFKNGIWYWYSSTTEDVLMEYGRCDSEEFDEAIQVLAWQPLPEPWKGGQDG